MRQEIENDVYAEDDPSRRRLGGGQSCGLPPGGYTFEWAIKKASDKEWKVTSWSKEAFCEHYTRVSYNLDVIKFLDDESMTGDFELAMRMTNTEKGRDGPVHCISHLYWA